MKEKVLQILKKIFPEYVCQFLIVNYLQIANKNKVDKYTLPYFYAWKFGSKEKYCVFRFRRPGSGLFAVATSYVFAYDWALSKGYIPIVDWEMDYTYVQSRIGEENIWDDIFLQEVDVKQVLHKDWVLVKTIGMYDSYNNETCQKINNKDDDCKLHIVTNGWREYYKKANELSSKCWNFQENLLTDVKNFYDIEMQGFRCLGVSLQEDFSKDANIIRTSKNAKEIYSLHPQTVGLVETINLVKDYFEKWKCDKIFLATVYQDSIDLFKKAFGNKVICFDRKRRELSNGTKNIEKVFDMSYEEIYNYYRSANVKYEEECIPYAKEVILLSKCSCLLAAPSSGTIAALTINAGEYDDIYIMYDYNHAQNY